MAYADIYHMFNREESIKSAFLFYEDKKILVFFLMELHTLILKKDQIDFHGRGIGAGLFAIGFIIIPWLLFNLALANPVRLDRKRRIIYTWARGYFVCIQFPSDMDNPMQFIEANVPLRNGAKDFYNMAGPLNIWLPYPKIKKNAPFSLGG